MEETIKSDCRLWADFDGKRIGLNVRIRDSDITAVSPDRVKLIMEEAAIQDMIVEVIEVEIMDSFPLSNIAYLLDAYKDTLKSITVKSIGSDCLTTIIEKDTPGNMPQPDLLSSLHLKNPFKLQLDWQRRLSQRDINTDLLEAIQFFKSLGVISDLTVLTSKHRIMEENTISQILEEIVSLSALTSLKVSINSYYPFKAFASFANPGIFPALKSVNLDFENVSLKEEGAKFVSQFIQTVSKTLENMSLNLRYNRLNDESVVQILDAIEGVEKLSGLSLAISANVFKEIGTERLAYFLQNNSFKLKNLALELKLLDVLNKDLSKMFLTSLANMHSIQHLKLHLALTQFARPNDDLQLLAAAFLSMVSLKTLSLDLSKSNLASNTARLFNAIGTIHTLESLSLSMFSMSFGERRLEAMENCILAQEKTLQELTLDLNLRGEYRGNNQIYLRLLQLLECNFPRMLRLNIKELKDIKGIVYIDVLAQLKRVTSKLFFRRKLIHSLHGFKKLILCRAFKRREIADEIAEFLNESEYVDKPFPPGFIPNPPNIQLLLQN